MAFTNSKIFRPFLADVFANTAAFDLSGTGVDTFKVALYGNSGTPDQNVTAANSAYNVAQWVTANEITDASNWPAGGRPLVSPLIDSATSATVFFDGNDTSSVGATTTVTNVYGVLVYDSTLATPVANQGVCFNYLGGPQSLTSGTFTVVWHANGIFRFTI